MREHRSEIELVASNPEPASFENTVLAIERAGRLLDRVTRVFWNLLSTNGTDELEAVAREFSRRLAEHKDAILLDARLFARLAVLEEQSAELGLAGEERELLRRYHLDFVRAGAGLDSAQKTALAAMNSELAGLAARFGQNVRKDSVRLALVCLTGEELEGLDPAALEAARCTALEQGLTTGYVLPLAAPTQQPALAVLRRRDVRARLFEAAIGRGASGGEFDNRAILARIVSLRAERARLLGFRNHAEYVLSDTTAGSVERVNQFLGELVPRAVAQARAEAALLQNLIDGESAGFALMAHDWAYYAQRERLACLDFEESLVRPYLEINRVLEQGAFFTAEKLYGIRFAARTDLPVYDPDVRVYEVFDHDGRPLALFLTDYYARPSKAGGAWANVYVPQSELLGTLPVVGNHLNVPKPAPGAPTLLTVTEVVSLFHEFGHALHAIFSRVRYPSLGGMNVPRDFVEFPSKFNETWAFCPEVLDNYARHHETGAPLPGALLQKVLEMRTFRQGMETTEYLAAAVLDQCWHQIEEPIDAADVERFEAQALERAGLTLASIPPRYRSGYFSHIFDGGYAAGYYAYLWSEVLDADAAAWFAEHGGLTRANGDWLRSQVLARGGTVDANDLFRQFRGRAADPGAMLARRGLCTPAAS
jgi:peptidyl-dipeptidase Dcp